MMNSLFLFPLLLTLSSSFHPIPAVHRPSVKLNSLDSLAEQLDFNPAKFIDGISSLKDSVNTLDTDSLLSSVTTSVKTLDADSPLSSLNDLDTTTLLSTLSPLAPPLAILITLSTAFNTLANPPQNYRNNNDPYKLYDPVAANEFYSKRPLLVARRLCQLLSKSNTLTFNLLVDKYVFKREEKMRPVRGQQILEFCEKGGATLIKIGQALSVRPDLIPPEYSERLSTLQDNVPPFPNDEALKLIQTELGATDLKLSAQTVAAASVGQVYKGVFKGEEIAVKVQRPNVLSEIALDLHIVRTIAPIYAKITNTATDLVKLTDEWGRGFVFELQYVGRASEP